MQNTSNLSNLIPGWWWWNPECSELTGLFEYVAICSHMRNVSWHRGVTCDSPSHEDPCTKNSTVTRTPCETTSLKPKANSELSCGSTMKTLIIEANQISLRVCLYFFSSCLQRMCVKFPTLFISTGSAETRVVWGGNWKHHFQLTSFEKMSAKITKTGQRLTKLCPQPAAGGGLLFYKSQCLSPILQTANQSFSWRLIDTMWYWTVLCEKNNFKTSILTFIYFRIG